jgi:hypothetical protein
MRAAEAPAAEKESTDHEIRALKDAVGAISKRLDSLMGGRGDGAKADAKADAEEHEEEEHEDKKDAARGDDDDCADDKKDARRRDKDLEDWAEEEKKEPNHKEDEQPRKLASDDKSDKRRRDATRSDEKEEDEEEKKEDRRDGRRRDARRRDEDEDGEAREDRRERSDARLDSAAIKRLIDQEVERRLDARKRSDDDLEKLGVAQQEWENVGQMHGIRMHRPGEGDTLLSYVRRCARKVQDHSPKWKNHDLTQLPANVLLDIAAPEIRADATAAAYTVNPEAPGMLREIIKRDRTGRQISEFVGSVAETLAPFRLPSARVAAFNTQPRQY